MDANEDLFKRKVIKNKDINDRLHYAKRVVTSIALIHQVVYTDNMAKLLFHLKSNFLN
jgi:hypothetical protein